MNESTGQSTGPRNGHQLYTHFPTHNLYVMQWLTNGGVSIVSHNSQQDSIGDAKDGKKEDLD